MSFAYSVAGCTNKPNEVVARAMNKATEKRDHFTTKSLDPFVNRCLTTEKKQKGISKNMQRTQVIKR